MLRRVALLFYPTSAPQTRIFLFLALFSCIFLLSYWCSAVFFLKIKVKKSGKRPGNSSGFFFFLWCHELFLRGRERTPWGTALWGSVRLRGDGHPPNGEDRSNMEDRGKETVRDRRNGGVEGHRREDSGLWLVWSKPRVRLAMSVRRILMPMKRRPVPSVLAQVGTSRHILPTFLNDHGVFQALICIRSHHFWTCVCVSLS